VLDDLTWICMICGDERPDAMIGVMSRPIDFGNDVVATLNVKYCVDKVSCQTGAQNYQLNREKDDGGGNE